MANIGQEEEEIEVTPISIPAPSTPIVEPASPERKKELEPA